MRQQMLIHDFIFTRQQPNECADETSFEDKVKEYSNKRSKFTPINPFEPETSKRGSPQALGHGRGRGWDRKTQTERITFATDLDSKKDGRDGHFDFDCIFFQFFFI